MPSARWPAASSAASASGPSSSVPSARSRSEAPGLVRSTTTGQRSADFRSMVISKVLIAHLAPSSAFAHARRTPRLRHTHHADGDQQVQRCFNFRPLRG